MEKITVTELFKRICRHPHPDTRKGSLNMARGLIENGKFNARWDITAELDLTGNLYIGKWTMIGAGVEIYTHDHRYEVKNLLETQGRIGVKWQNKTIGNDVWINKNSIILYQVTEIPDGVVIGGGSVLTKNPGPYEIWAGNPAKFIRKRLDK